MAQLARHLGHIFNVLDGEGAQTAAARTLLGKRVSKRSSVLVVPNIFGSSLIRQVIDAGVRTETSFLAKEFGKDALDRIVLDKTFADELLKKTSRRMRDESLGSKANNVPKDFPGAQRMSIEQDGFERANELLYEMSDSFERAAVAEETSTR